MSNIRANSWLSHISSDFILFSAQFCLTLSNVAYFTQWKLYIIKQYRFSYLLSIITQKKRSSFFEQTHLFLVYKVHKFNGKFFYSDGSII